MIVVARDRFLVDIYLLPSRAGGHFLYSGALDEPPPASPSESDSTARRLRVRARRVYDRLTKRRREKELLLRHLGSLDHARILYPSSLSPNEAHRNYDELLQREIAKHKKWMVANTAALPASIPLSLIPGPNLLLGYLAWRSVSHYKTKKASEKATELAIDFVPDTRLAELSDLVGRWPFRARLAIRRIGDELGLAQLDRAY